MNQFKKYLSLLVVQLLTHLDLSSKLHLNLEVMTTAHSTRTKAEVEVEEDRDNNRVEVVGVTATMISNPDMEGEMIGALHHQVRGTQVLLVNKIEPGEGDRLVLTTLATIAGVSTTFSEPVRTPEGMVDLLEVVGMEAEVVATRRGQ